jgi:uncharacterized protein (DUF58 family)
LRNYSSYTLLTDRGQYVLGPTVVSSGDPFGLFSFKRIIPGDRTVLVLPYMVDLNSFPFPIGLLPGGKAKQKKTPEVTPQAAGVREYASGDSLNRIHWPSTIRRNQLMVKEFEQDPQSDIWIFIDSQRSIHLSRPRPVQSTKVDQFWLWRHNTVIGLPEDTYEYSLSIAASISKYFLRKSQTVGLASAGQQTTIVTPERGERQLGKILEELALLKPNGSLPLPALVEIQSAHLSRGTTVIMITPSVNLDVAKAVDSLRFRGIRPIVIFVDPQSFGGEYGLDEVYPAVQTRGVPSLIIKNGADLRKVLEAGSIK